MSAYTEAILTPAVSRDKGTSGFDTTVSAVNQTYRGA